MEHITILLVGIRGSGKTTQTQLLCNQSNFIPLDKDKVFTNKQDNQWNTIIKFINTSNQGIIFDRCIRNIEDVYYLDHILRQKNRCLNIIICLDISISNALNRITIRGDGKPIKFGEELNTIQQIENSKFNFVKINASQSQEIVTHEILNIIKTINIVSQPIVPPILMNNIFMCTNPIILENIKNDIHFALQLKLQHKFPGTQISGYIDKQTLNELIPWLKNYFVSIKADGLRFLFVMDSNNAYLISSNYNSLYIIPNNLIPTTLLSIKGDFRKYNHNLSLIICYLKVKILQNIIFQQDYLFYKH